MLEQKRLVAVADVLGFTETVLTRPLEEVVAGPVAFVRRCLRHSAHQDGWPADYLPMLEEIRDQDRVGVAWFSDTILLYALSDETKHAKALVETAAWLQFETFHGSRSALRVGIDYDELYADPEGSIFVGRGLIGAYRLEEAQDWVGGAFTKNASERLVGVGVDDYIEEYDVPLKEQSVSVLALKWIAIPHQKPQLRFQPSTQALMDAPNDRVRESILRKWRNAERFHEERCEICRLNWRGA